MCSKLCFVTTITYLFETEFVRDDMQDKSKTEYKRTTSFTFSIVLFVSSLVVLVSIISRFIWYSSGSRLQLLLQGLLLQEQRVQPKSDIHVVVGIGSCLDAKANAFQIFNLSGFHTPLPALHHDVIQNEQDLLETFAFFFNEGAAGERYVSNKTLFGDLVNYARQLDSTVWTLGGNAYVIANRMAQEGLSVTLAGHLTAKDHKLLHPGLTPLPVESDVLNEYSQDIHLILEYGTNASWGGYRTPRANRFIVHSDQHNPRLLALDGFMKFVQRKNPRLVVISGLQMLDNFPFKTRELELLIQRLGRFLQITTRDSLVHFEMASFSDRNLLQLIKQHVIPYVDSLGMNEQELSNLVSILERDEVTLLADQSPKLEDVLALIRQLYRSTGHKSDAQLSAGEREVTRIHVHSITFQLVLVRLGSAWKKPRVAAAKASLVATRHTCNQTDINLDYVKLEMPESYSPRDTADTAVEMDAENPVQCWIEGGTKICVAPLLVCTKIMHTSGGGDNISGAGLVPQL